MQDQSTTAALAHRVAKAAERIGVSRAQLYKLIKSGELRSFHIGARTLIAESELQQFIAKRLGMAA